MSDAELRRLLDEAAIRRLTASYGDAVSHLDADRAASVYAEDGRVSIAGSELVGRAAIRAGMAATFAAFSLLRIVEHGGIVVADGDGARARWSTVEYSIRVGATALNLMFGRYEDELVRVEGEWRFARRSFTLAARTQVATGKLQANPAFLPPGLPLR